jgi:hypothetical protein
MNENAKSKINFIETELHKLARKNCPKFIDCSCQLCDIECPYEQIFTFLHHVKNENLLFPYWKTKEER